MKLKQEKIIPKSATPLAAMIDVTFLMLIFFIVTQQDIKEESFIQVNLANHGKPRPNSLPSIDIHVLADSYVFLGRHYTNAEKLGLVLKEYLALSSDLKVNLKLSSHAQQIQLVRLTDICAREGLGKFNLFFLKDGL